MSSGDHDIATDPVIRAVLIEDDQRLAELTVRYLANYGVLVTHCADGRSGLQEALRTSPDIVLLDLQLPALDGLAVCRELRSRSSVPVVIISAREEEADRVLGLELGADDYVAKPFSSRELLARIRANVRRAQGRVGPPTGRIQIGPLVLDTSAQHAELDGRPLSLTAYEFSLLRALAENVGRALRREQLLYLARGSAEESFDRSIDVQISRLRAKLGDDPKNPRLLKTVRGLGYMLTLEPKP